MENKELPKKGNLKLNRNAGMSMPKRPHTPVPGSPEDKKALEFIQGGGTSSAGVSSDPTATPVASTVSARKQRAAASDKGYKTATLKIWTQLGEDINDVLEHFFPIRPGRTTPGKTQEAYIMEALEKKVAEDKALMLKQKKGDS